MKNKDYNVPFQNRKKGTSNEELASQLAQIATNVKSFGANGDGVTNDTVSIQNALNSGHRVRVPKGTYMIDALTSLKMNSNQTLEFEDGAEFKAIPNSAAAYTVLLIDGKENVKIINAIIRGERSQHTGTTGEWGACLKVISSNNVLIENCLFSDSWGDGLYIGGTDSTIHNECENIIIRNVVCDNNRRLGMALTAVRNVKIYDSTFKNTAGTSPEAGIDIEPNTNFYCEKISIVNCVMNNNNTSGFIASTVSGGLVQNIQLLECDMSDNIFDGAELIGGINVHFTNCKLNNNRNGVNSYVNSVGTKVTNCEVTGNSVMGIRAYNSNDTVVEISIIKNNGDNGIFFKGTRCKAIRNIVSNNSKTGILLDTGADYSEVSNNDVLNNVQSGIYVAAYYCKLYRNYLNGNCTNATSSSMEIYSQNSIAKYNEVELGSGSAVYGLRMTAGTNNVVTYNDFTGSGITGNTQVLTQTNSHVFSNFDSVRTGTTAQRPTAVDLGFEYFDTTLNKPIYWTGSAWKDVASVTPENRGINIAVGASATSLNVTLPTAESNASYIVHVATQWNTAWWITSKATTGFTINFATAPVSSSALDWSIRR